jgi:hypothetical protein
VEATVAGPDRSFRTVCDIELPPSTSWDAARTVDLTASRQGCTSGEGLVAQSRVTDFSEYAIGVTPYDWATADQSGAPDPSWTVEAGTGIGGQQLQRAATASGLSGIAWSDIIQQDLEVLAKIRTSNVDPAVWSPLLELRIDPVAVQAYVAALRGGQQLLIGRLQAGAAQDITTNPTPFAYLADAWLWLRFSVNGNDLSARVWPDGASPTGPAAAAISVLNSDVQDAGYTGFVVLNDAADQVDFVSIGMAGSVALPPLSMTCLSEAPPYFMCPSTP